MGKTTPRAPMDLSRDLEGQLLKRAEAADFTVSEDERSIEFPFSSEYPVARYFGNEILAHTREAVDLARLSDGAPLLFNHDPGKVIGVVERAWIDGKKKRGYVAVKFSRNAFAQEVLADVKDGVLRNVSVGYQIADMEQRGEDFVATRWSPYEVSVVSIPADPTVGVGRALDAQPAAPAATPTPQPEPEVPMDNTPDISAVRAEAAAEAAKAERTRIAGISALTEKHGMADLGRQLIEGGRSLDEARTAVLDQLGVKVQPVSETAADIGMSANEVRSFSFQRAINALANPNNREAWNAAAFERECSEAAQQRAGKPSQGIMVPSDVLRGQRDLVVGTSTAGGNLVSTDLRTGDFVDLLRNRLALANVGATVLNGLQGNVSIPRQTTAASAFWVGEGGNPTESQQAFDQISMTPKTIGAFVDYSRKLLLQGSIDVESMIRMDLARVLSLEIDRVGIYGTGSTNQPLGLTNTTGLGSQTITGTGTFAEYVSMETKVAVANADVASMSYIINATSRGALKTTEKSAGGTVGNFALMDNTLNGYSVVVSNQLGTNDCLFGDFSQMILGLWSGLDLKVDDITGATAGTVRVIALQDLDFAVKQPGAFVFGT
ncbi:MAG: phage major capsid protein [Rhodospirillales bacterium]|nr:phage major capsid protein [Rhodospirillales bacterium]